ncbi:MAG TPA: hypothetical protein VGI85_03220 [Chthoniobacterales bacterium]|jgi:hypothetical protein
MTKQNQSPKKLRLAETPEEQKRWMAQWRLAEAALLEVKREELRALSDADAIGSFNALDMPAEMIYRSPEREQSLGLAEQQRIFGKVRNH